METTNEIDWSGLPLIRSEPGKLGGAPNVEGTRITPEAFVDNWEDGESVEDILDTFDGVSERQVRTVLDYAAKKGYLTRPYPA
jgi:uncharacterized protein (DUF433 family)